MDRVQDRQAFRLTYIGHATVALDLAGERVLTDPVLRDRVAFLRRVPPSPPSPLPVSVAVVSHLHPDHCDLPSLRALGQIPIVVPAGATAFLHSRGLRRLVELAPGESAAVGNVVVTATPARHDGRRMRFGGPEAAAVGYVVSAAGRRVYFAGDTDLFEGMHALGPLDVALLPVWGWGPTLGAGHLTPETAAEAVARLRPRLAVPMHWGTFAMVGLGRRTTARPAHRFVEAVARCAVPSRALLLPPGGSTALDTPLGG